MVKSCIHTVRPPQLHQNILYLLDFVPYVIGQYRIPQNSVKTYKFCVNGQIPRLCSVPWKTVVPSPVDSQFPLNTNLYYFNKQYD